MLFKKATKKSSRLRAALIGPAGSGKTYSALLLAQHLVPGGKVAVIDTERGSASKYADLFSFDVLELETFGPETYVKAIQAAEGEGYDVIVIDSLSHAWSGKDGALEKKDAATKRNSGNSWTAWRDVTPAHNAMVDAILRCRAHVIVTMRAKTEYVQEKDERTGKTVVRKIGLKPDQRDGLEYEFDVVGTMDDENNFVVSKTRCSKIAGAVVAKPGADLAKTLRDWLTDGVQEPETQRSPAPAPAPPPGSVAAAAVATAAPDATAEEKAKGWRESIAGAKGKSLIEHADKVAALQNGLGELVRAAYAARWLELVKGYDPATRASVAPKLAALPEAITKHAGWAAVLEALKAPAGAPAPAAPAHGAGT